jgi:hypothetical protein
MKTTIPKDWRRGVIYGSIPYPKELGKAIDRAIAIFKSENLRVSDCCQAPIVTAGDKSPVTTWCYACTSCRKPCDIDFLNN